MPTPTPNDQRMLELADSFPSLRGLMTTWNAKALEEWACGPAPGSGALMAAQFVLSVWNQYEHWKCGRFDFHRAVCCWDQRHRQALFDWMQDPWFP